MEPVKLYGMMLSGNTGRARSYFLHAGIPYREIGPSTPHYVRTVVPQAGGVATMPTIEFADGRVIRDGAAIIDHFEDQSGHAFSPSGPKQRFISRLFDVIGSEGFLRSGMHYRWNYDEENLAFLMYQNRRLVPQSELSDDIFDQMIEKMRSGTRKFGVNPDTYALIESLYGDVLAALHAHFDVHPYLLGGRPSFGDFGLNIMLFAHLGRDPKPLSVMVENGMAVFRWVERMNRPGGDLDGFACKDETYLPDDEVPQTLIDLLAVIAEDFVPETLAAADTINGWLAGQDGLAPGTPVQRGVGFGEFEVRGVRLSALAQPYRFYLLKRAQDDYAALSTQDRQAMDAILDQCGMTPLLRATLTRDIGRKDNLEVWL